MRPENKLDRISEKIYLWSFVLVAVVILIAIIGSMLASYLMEESIVLVPDNVFKFISQVLYVFVIPLSIKIVGDRLPYLAEIIRAWRSVPAATNTELPPVQDVESGLGR
jgi:hypothetical protein